MQEAHTLRLGFTSNSLAACSPHSPQQEAENRPVVFPLGPFGGRGHFSPQRRHHSEFVLIRYLTSLLLQFGHTGCMFFLLYNSSAAWSEHCNSLSKQFSQSLTPDELVY